MERAHVDTIEKLAVLMQEGFEELESNTKGLRVEMHEGFLAVEGQFREVRHRLSGVEHRLEVIEEKVEGQGGYAKEIDHLNGRVSKIEKHLKFS